MNWDIIGGLAESLGLVAFIVTLIYLTTKIGQNAAAMHQQKLIVSTTTWIGTSLIIGYVTRKSLGDYFEIMNYVILGLGSSGALIQGLLIKNEYFRQLPSTSFVVVGGLAYILVLLPVSIFFYAFADVGTYAMYWVKHFALLLLFPSFALSAISHLMAPHGVDQLKLIVSTTTWIGVAIIIGYVTISWLGHFEIMIFVLLGLGFSGALIQGLTINFGYFRQLTFVSSLMVGVLAYTSALLAVSLYYVYADVGYLLNTIIYFALLLLVPSFAISTVAHRMIKRVV